MIRITKPVRSEPTVQETLARANGYKTEGGALFREKKDTEAAL